MWLHAAKCMADCLPDSLPFRCSVVQFSRLTGPGYIYSMKLIWLANRANLGVDSYGIVVSFAEQQENLKAKATAATLWLSPPCRHSWLGIGQGVALKYRTMYRINSNVLEMLDVERRQVTFVSTSVWTKPSERRVSGTSLRQVRSELEVETNRPSIPREHFLEGLRPQGSHRPHRH